MCQHSCIAWRRIVIRNAINASNCHTIGLSTFDARTIEPCSKIEHIIAIFRACIDQQPHQWRHHIGSIWLDAELTDCCREMPRRSRKFKGLFVNLQHQFWSRDKRIGTLSHRCGACMICTAFDDDFKPADTGNGSDNADIFMLGFQHRPLLDMQLHKGCKIRTALA